MTEAMNARGETVYMVGAGNSAGQAAMFFKDHADRVIMLVRGESLSAKMSRYLVDRIEAAPNIEVRLNTEIMACYGTDRLDALELVNGTGVAETVPAGVPVRVSWSHAQD